MERIAGERNAKVISRIRGIVGKMFELEDPMLFHRAKPNELKFPGNSSIKQIKS